MPGELRPLIGMCLAKEPGDRPTASDLVAELADVRLRAERLQERTTAMRAGFAVATPTQSVRGAASNGAAPCRCRGGPWQGGGPRRFPRLRRSLLIPAVSAAAVVAAVPPLRLAPRLSAVPGGPFSALLLRQPHCLHRHPEPDTQHVGGTHA